MNTKLPQKGEFYYHFKHNPQLDILNYAYLIVGVALHSENAEKLVAYLPLYSPNHVWDYKCDFNVRPLEMFIGLVEKSDINYSGPRFNWITNKSIISQLKQTQIYKNYITSIPCKSI